MGVVHALIMSHMKTGKSIAIPVEVHRLTHCIHAVLYGRDGWYNTRIIDTTDTDTDTDTYSIDTWFLASSIRYLIKLTWRIVFQGWWTCGS